MILERDVEKKLVEAVKKLGGRALKWTCPGSNGVPDRIVFMPDGKVYFVELKRPTGVLSARQKVVHKMLGDLGTEVHVLYNLEDVNDFIDLI